MDCESEVLWSWYGEWDKPGKALNRDTLFVVGNRRNHLEGDNENNNVMGVMN